MQTVTRKITRNGNSSCVALPPSALSALSVQAGDSVDISFDGDHVVLSKHETVSKSPLEWFEQALSAVETLPAVPWLDDSKQADRDLMGERYA